MDYYIIAYDIADPKRLHKIYKAIKGFGKRLQLSVFECYLTPVNLVLLKEKITDIIAPAEDRVIIIRCCPTCQGKVQTLGTQRTCKEPTQPTIV